MAKLCPLFSSSRGNSTYIGSSVGGILVDVGVSLKALGEALLSVGTDFADIKAIAITHEHTDHIKCLKTLLKKHKIPVIASSVTLKTLKEAEIISDNDITYSANDELLICGIKVTRFPTSHDCEGSSGYTVVLPEGKKIGICTDLGVMTDAVRHSLFGCDVILIESNHDIELLKKGPYPPELKMRIMSEKGHLSNSACARELCSFFEKGTRRFVLGHLSEHNNLPTVAMSCAKAALMDKGAVFGEDYMLFVAKPAHNEVVYI